MYECVCIYIFIYIVLFVIVTIKAWSIERTRTGVNATCLLSVCLPSDHQVQNYEGLIKVEIVVASWYDDPIHEEIAFTQHS